MTWTDNFGKRTGTSPHKRILKYKRVAIKAPTALNQDMIPKVQEKFQHWKLQGGIYFELLTLISFD